MDFLYKYVFSFLIAVGVFFRLQFVLQNSNWLLDSSRDFLVAKNIGFYGDSNNLVPYSAYNGNTLANSFFYYSFISLFTIFHGDPTTYQVLFCMFFLFAIYFSALFLARSLTKNRLSQFLIVLIFFSYSNFFWPSLYAFQPNFAIPFLLLSIASFSYSYRHKSAKYLFIAVLFYSISIHIHYANLSLFPLLVICLYFFHTKKINVLLPTLLLIGSVLLIFVNQILVYGLQNSYENLSFFFNQLFLNKDLGSATFLQNFIKNFYIFLGENYFEKIIYLAITLFILLSLFFMRKKHLFIISLSSVFILFVTFSLLDAGLVQRFYFYPIYTVVIVSLIILIVSLGEKLRNFLLLLLLFSFAAQTYLGLDRYLQCFSENQNKKEIVFAIAADIEAKNLESTDFYLQTIGSTINEENTIYLLFLQEELKTRLLKNRNDGEISSYINLIPFKDKTKNLYLICDNPNLKLGDHHKKSWCLEYFLNNNLLEKYELVFPFKEENLVLYYLQLKEPINNHDYIYLFSNLIGS